MSKLIIISGSEAVGKSHIGHELAKRLRIKYLSKDTIKEKMFNESTISTWRYSYYEREAKKELFHQIEKYLAPDNLLIIEANFKPWDEQRLRRLLHKNTEVYEIFCFAKGFTAFRRFVARNESGQRHPGHHDRRWYFIVFIYSVCSLLKIKWPYRPMKISDEVLYLDTTNPAHIDYPSIIKFISQGN